MIFYLVTEEHAYTMGGYLQSWGQHLARQIHLIRYDALLEPKELKFPFGTWIFSDIDRLPSKVQAVAIRLRDEMAKDGQYRMLNDPARSMRRYELLRTLHERGENGFDVYRLTEARLPRRYPVFIRMEDHQRLDEQLISSEEILRKMLDAIVSDGVARDELLIVEQLDTADAKGVYRKYGAFRVGNRIVPRHVLFNSHWWVKEPADVVPEEQAREELEYVTGNPHAEQLMKIFELARIQFGRIDYSLHNGRIQVWEINTNPVSLAAKHRNNAARLPAQEHFAKEYEAALKEIGGW